VSRDAEAGANPDVRRETVTLDSAPNALVQCLRLLMVRIGRNDQKLLAAPAAQHVDDPQQRPNAAPDLLQDPVPGLVTVDVVDAL